MPQFIVQNTQHTLQFKQPAGTSRGIYTERHFWILTISDKDGTHIGQGEIAPLPKLSCDDVPNLQQVIDRACEQFDGNIDYKGLLNYPSVLFGFESAWRNYQTDGKGEYRFWDNSFTKGERGIDINGLIWMGSYDVMKQRVEEKLKAGFHCIKVKIGAIDFEEEYELLRKIRNDYYPQEITLRVDANGGFSPQEALEKLKRLSELDIHSIEQPIRAGQWEAMAQLCEQSPIPIALDEELIGINQIDKKIKLLDTIRPAFIILKPTLHGSFSGCDEWIRLAKERNIGYWATSALESNLGLAAIAQWAAQLDVTIPQGLGTGALFTENLPAPLKVIGEKLWFCKNS